MDGKIADRKGYEYIRKIVSVASNGLGGSNGSGAAAVAEAKSGERADGSTDESKVKTEVII